jgi:hypothetical protein
MALYWNIVNFTDIDSLVIFLIPFGRVESNIMVLSMRHSTPPVFLSPKVEKGFSINEVCVSLCLLYFNEIF